jgi:hypothetical protein
MTELDPQTIHLVPGDETVLKYLGAAVVLQGHNIPPDAQQTLLRQASAIGGLPLAGDLQREIEALIGRART